MESKRLKDAAGITMAAVLAITINGSAAWGLSRISTKGQQNSVQPVATQFALTGAGFGTQGRSSKV